MAHLNTRLLDTIDLTGDEPIITTKAVKDICIDLSDDEEVEDEDKNTPPVAIKKKKVVNPNRKCEICLDAASKYTCPACCMRTCCLDCVLEHKVRTGCSGQRDQTSFVARSDFDNIHLLNDYRLLEEVTRIADNARRDYKGKRPWKEPKNLTDLKRFSDKAGVSLYLMEKGMKRQRENRSRYIFSEKSIKWTVKFMFPDIGKEFMEWCLDRELLIDILAKYIDKDKVLAEYKIPFSEYHEKSDDVAVFFRNEFDPGDNQRYQLVDHTRTLKDCLVEKSVLEYPVFYVVRKESARSYSTEEFVKDRVVCTASPQPMPLEDWVLKESAKSQSTEEPERSHSMEESTRSLSTEESAKLYSTEEFAKDKAPRTTSSQALSLEDWLKS